MKVLVLRFDAPLIAFGGTVVDARNITDDMPSRSMITGLLGNALGYDHRDVDRLARLQARLRVAARRDVVGERLVDFQTVDLGQDFLAAGWTTSGRSEGREGGSAASGTHIRYRHYLADAAYTVAVALRPADESPTIDALAVALEAPARPLFLGRKCCLPSTPILDPRIGDGGVVEASSLLDVLRRTPRIARRRASWNAPDRRCLVRVPSDERVEGFSERAVTEDRDWPNQIHVGRSIVLEGFVELDVAGGAP